MLKAAILVVALAGAAVVPGSPTVREWSRGEVMQHSPRISLNSASKAPAHLTAPRSRVFRYFGGHVARAGSTLPDSLFLRPDNLTSRNEAPPWFVTFKAQGRFVIFTKGTGRSEYRLRLDNKLATAAPQPGPPGDTGLYTITVPVSGRHTVVIEMSGTFFFGGVAGKLNRATYSLGPRAIFFGDSITEGVGADSSFTSYVQGTAFRLGWGDTWASGASGTGYLSSEPGRPNFVERFSTDVLPYHPKVLVLAGGLNDQGRFTPEQISAAAESMIVRCRCKTVVLSSWWPKPGPTSANVTELNRQLAVVAHQHGAAYVDVSSWRYPTTDGIHPTQAGHEQIAAQLAPAIRAALGQR
jgi:lysophospholipase L1-like esterase